MAASTSNDLKSSLGKLEDTLNEYLVKKSPVTLPTNIKEVIVKFAPWVTLVLLVMTLPILLAVFGLGAILTPLSFLGGVNAGVNYMITMVVSAVTVVLEGLAIPGLFKKSKGGWNLVFYASLVGVVQNVLTFNVGGLVIGSLLGLYFLFQVREYYK